MAVVSSRGLLGCDAMECTGRIPMFQRSMLHGGALTSETLVSYHNTDTAS
jgi:hypothetical protein